MNQGELGESTPVIQWAYSSCDLLLDFSQKEQDAKVRQAMKQVLQP